MAIYRFSAQIISRSSGRSVVAAAAYRSASRLRDERLDLTFSFEKKPGVEHTEILAPEGAPEWVFHRQTLWNAVEAREKLVNSQLAREVQLALPCELPPEAQREVVREFIKKEFVSRGMVADFAIHREHDDNPHVHVMLTMRDLRADGFGNKNTEWNNPAMLHEWRASWARHLNYALAKAGVAERVDHRSYEAQGIDLEPQPKLFRRATEAHLDSRDHVLDRLSECQRTIRRNGERIIARPEIALELLSARQPTFTKRDIQRLVHRQTADATQFDKAMRAVEASRELVSIQGDEERYTTRTTEALERALHKDGGHLHKSRRHIVKQAFVEQALTLAPRQLNDEQAAAVRQITQGSDLAIVEGYAGTGKSTMLAAARCAWEAQGYRVVGGALAGKAAEGLSESSGIESRTLASWQHGWSQGRNKLTSRDVMVLDEAGMIGTRQLAEVLSHVRKAGAKLVLVGDTKQLQAIEPGAPMRVFAAEFGAARLQNIRRQTEHRWQAEASLKFANFNTTEALQDYTAQGRVHGLTDADGARAALIDAWQRDRLAHPGQTSLLMAFRRKDVRALNEAARTVRRATGELGEDHQVLTTQGERSFAEGERIYFLKNDRTLGVTNGSLGTVQAVVGSSLIVELDNKKQIVVDTRAYNAIDHGYAGTIHKGQGVTVDRGYVLASKYLDASATYVAMTRHAKDAQLFYSKEEFATEERLFRSLSRVKTTRMVYEVSAPEFSAPAVAREARQIDRSERLREAFFGMSPETRARKMEALAQLASSPTTHPTECLESLNEMKTAVAAKHAAVLQRAEAEAALNAFRVAHPVKTHLDTAEHRALMRNLQHCEEALLEASLNVRKVERDPKLRARAERLAAEHNQKRRNAQVALTKLHELEALAARRAELERAVATANSVEGGARVRLAEADDVGRDFTLIAHRNVKGRPVSVLRDDRGALLLVDASAARSDQDRAAVGARLTLQPTMTLSPSVTPNAPRPSGRGL